MTEFLLLKFLLYGAFVLAPIMTNKFFLNESRLYSEFHKATFIILVMAATLNVNSIAFVLPLFCAFGFFLYLKLNYKFIFSTKGLVACIPFAFSLISSAWFVAGVNDLHLLGYNRTWSFYAALHGSFLGWLFVGCLAYLSRQPGSNKIYLWGCYLSLSFFLFVAFGIDGVSYVKRIGVIGFSLMVPILIGMYAYSLKKQNKLSLFLAAVSLCSTVASMTLATFNEFWEGFPRVVLGIPMMVLTHGLLNAVLAVPCFFLAIQFERKMDCDKTLIQENVIFFDGVCVLCGGTVALLVKIDRNKKLKYSALQGNFAHTKLNLTKLRSSDSVIFSSEGIVYERAEAVIHIFIKLGGMYRFLGFALRMIPLFILNVFFNFIARHRYGIFGKNDTCLIPTEEIKDRFIS